MWLRLAIYSPSVFIITSRHTSKLHFLGSFTLSVATRLYFGQCNVEVMDYFLIRFINYSHAQFSLSFFLSLITLNQRYKEGESPNHHLEESLPPGASVLGACHE